MKGGAVQHNQLIARYFDDMKGSDPKEAPRRDKFLVLLQALFPSSAEELRRTCRTSSCPW